MSQDTLEKFTLVHVPIFSPLYIYIYIYIYIYKRIFKALRNPSYIIERSYLVVNHSQTRHVLYQLYPSLDVTDLFSTESFKKLGSNFKSIHINEQKCLNKQKSIYRYFRSCKTYMFVIWTYETTDTDNSTRYSHRCIFLYRKIFIPKYTSEIWMFSGLESARSKVLFRSLSTRLQWLIWKAGRNGA